MITHSVPVYCVISYERAIETNASFFSCIRSAFKCMELKENPEKEFVRNMWCFSLKWTSVKNVTPKNVNNIVGRLIRQTGNMGIMFAWFHRSCSNACYRQLVERRILLWHIIAISFRFVCCRYSYFSLILSISSPYECIDILLHVRMFSQMLLNEKNACTEKTNVENLILKFADNTLYTMEYGLFSWLNNFTLPDKAFNGFL